MTKVFWLAVEQGLALWVAVICLLVCFVSKFFIIRTDHIKGDDIMANLIFKLYELVNEIIPNLCQELAVALLSA